LLALTTEQVVGLAAFSAIYPGPGLTPGFFLKDLYVRQSHRGSGLGKQLMGRLATMARDEGIGQIDWTVDADDQRLRQFYETLGGHAVPEKLFYRLSGARLGGVRTGLIPDTLDRADP
jgi:GNAT superfamily N-acetyltransferase